METQFSIRACLVSALIIMVMMISGGCVADAPLNPAFPLKTAEAKETLRSLRDDPVMPPRPIVVLGGILDPGLIAPGVARDLRKVTHPDAEIIAVSFFGANTFDRARDRVLDRVEERLGATDIEVDVLGFSMGGIVARHAAATPDDDGRTLNIARLFTISTPHRGANMAWMMPWDKRAKDMKAGSELLTRLDEAIAADPFPIYAYARLGDVTVGEENAAPPGVDLWWVATPALEFSHMQAAHDPRIMADIAQRLRD